MPTSQYFENITRALVNFQHLEVILKFYVRDCDKLIQKSVKSSFHYAVREKEIEKMPLGRLIKEFSQRSNRKDIISALKMLNKHRNFVAHSAFLLTVEEQHDLPKMKEFSQKVAKVTGAVTLCLHEVYKELSLVKKEPISREILDLFQEWKRLDESSIGG